MRNLIAEDIKIFSSDAKLSAAFTAATTDIITSAAHGLIEGDLIQVSSSTTLPAGLSASTDYYVRDVTTNTFKVSTTMGGSAVDITDTGTGTHTLVLKGKKVLVSDASVINLSVHTTGSANFLLQVQGSEQEDVDFNAAASPSNRWTYLTLADLSTPATKYAGDTGYTEISGTDRNKLFEVNVNGVKFITILITTWVAGQLDAKASLYGN